MISNVARGHVFITANSPGEIAGWVSPLVEALKRRDPSVMVSLVITPCQYASGTEAEVAAELPGVDRVVRIGRLTRQIVFGGKGNRHLGECSCVLFMGGDALYAVLLSKLLKLPAFAYIGKPRWRKHFHKYMVTDANIRGRFLHAGVSPEKIAVVGHLSLDSARVTASRDEIMARLGLAGDSEVVTFLPGSRPFEIEFLIPFFAQTAEIMRERFPRIQLFFAISPFAKKELIVKSAARVNARITSQGEMVTSGGCRVRLALECPHELMSVSRLIVTIPGTNNLQIAAMGVPMLIVTPLNKAEDIPMDGLLGLLNPRIFPIGLIKRRLLLSRTKHMKYVSLPNIIAGREIVPEMLDILEPRDVAEKASSLLRNPGLCETISRDLREITRHRGAAERIASLVLSGRAESPQEVRRL